MHLLVFWYISDYTYALGFSTLLVGTFVMYTTFKRNVPKVEATAYKCCTLGRDEYEALAPALSRIVRHGRISNISDSEICMKNGKINADKNTVIIDCSSNGLTPRTAVPVWQGDKMILQCTQAC
jgi:hypothetical protein